MLQSIQIASEQNASTKLAAILDDVAGMVASGSSLQMALEEYPDVFESHWIALVGTGEVSGTGTEYRASPSREWPVLRWSGLDPLRELSLTCYPARGERTPRRTEFRMARARRRVLPTLALVLCLPLISPASVEASTMAWHRAPS